MNDSIKEHLREAGDDLNDLLEELEDGLENLAEEGREGWQHFKQAIRKSNLKLQEAAEKLEQDSDEMRLQSHLAAMEARIRFEAARDTLVDFAQSARQQSRQIADHARLQAHLAEMDSRDFVAEARDAVGGGAARYGDEIQVIQRELLQLGADIRKRFNRADA